MGCVASKHGVSVTPAFDNSASLQDHERILPSLLPTSRSKHFPGESDRRRKVGAGPGQSDRRRKVGAGPGESEEPVRWFSNAAGESTSFRLSALHAYVEGEQVAAGWPAWLSAVAGEAIRGWVPLRADSFQKLEKIGQGTYSSVFRACNLDTGKMVALKKVCFDYFEPESVRFMAREIQILRKLDHPNIVKLEGLIASQLSSSIYFVFEYMEHDLAGLLACPEIKFSESQAKCYLHQLLSGLSHCHSHGVMHRDIKGANLLVNNEGILKIADFGLANFLNSGQGQPLTSRVVTLWYRPPELLLGSTNYVASVDLWSVGCVFAELLLGKPILQGRTEVEQLHKIFKLCGSPPEEYWKKSKLPHCTVIRPQHPYQSTLKKTFKDVPATAFGLIETLLSVEPYKRGTALSALKSEYFKTKPCACDPSSLPKYPPCKEIDAKIREESRRKRRHGRGHGSGVMCRPGAKPELCRLETCIEEPQNDSNRIINDNLKKNILNKDGKSRLLVDLQPMPQINSRDEDLCAQDSLARLLPLSGPLQVSTSSGFAWAKKFRQDSTSIRSNNRCSLKCHTSNTLEPSHVIHSEKTNIAVSLEETGVTEQEDKTSRKDQVSYRGKSCKTQTKQELFRQWLQLGHPAPFSGSGIFCSQEFSESFCLNDELPSNRGTLGYQDQEEDKVVFSGPLLSQSHKVDELLAKHEKHIRQATHQSWWFQRGLEHGK